MKLPRNSCSFNGDLNFSNSLLKDKTKLNEIKKPTGKEREKLQEVDELVAKAVSFRNVSKVS